MALAEANSSSQSVQGDRVGSHIGDYGGEARKKAAEDRERARKAHAEEEAARNKEYREQLRQAGAHGKEITEWDSAKIEQRKQDAEERAKAKQVQAEEEKARQREFRRLLKEARTRGSGGVPSPPTAQEPLRRAVTPPPPARRRQLMVCGPRVSSPSSLAPARPKSSPYRPKSSAARPKSRAGHPPVPADQTGTQNATDSHASGEPKSTASPSPSPSDGADSANREELCGQNKREEANAGSSEILRLSEDDGDELLDQSKHEEEHEVLKRTIQLAASEAAEAGDETSDAKTHGSAAGREDVEAIFKKWDCNGDGLISEDELRSVLVQLGAHIHHIHGMFTAMDANRDGMVDYGEFIAYLFKSKDSDVSDRELNTQLDDVWKFICKEQQNSADSSDSDSSDHELDAPGAIGQEVGAEEDSVTVAEFIDKAGAEDKADIPEPSGGHLSTMNIMGAAMEAMVSPSDAMHPARAEPAESVIQNEEARIKSLDEVHDSDDIITRLFFDSLPKGYIQIDSIERVIQRTLLKRFFSKLTERRSSIEMAFHGTDDFYVEDIIAKGLRTDTCLTGNYGDGAYVGVHAGLAHQYANADKNGQRYMFCILVNVGEKLEKGMKGRRHEVTTADREWNPTQYCFVDDERLLVTHLIKYRVLDKPWPRAGMSLCDPYQRSLIQACSRADRQAKRRGLR